MLKTKTAPPILDEKVLIETYRGMSDAQQTWLWTTLLFSHMLPYETMLQIRKFTEANGKPAT